MKYQDPTVLPQSQTQPTPDKGPIDTSKLKPSELIRLALHDLELCENSPRYIIDMCFWHGPFLGQDYSTCNVCFAGSVMAITKQTPLYVELGVRDLPPEIRSLDFFRTGDLDAGLAMLGINHRTYRLPDHVRAIPYAIDRGGFKKDMNTLADLLENHGL